MAATGFFANVLGIPHIPSVKEVNIRSGPHTSNALLFRVAVGVSGIRVVGAATDTNGDNLNGKVYTWLQLQFNDGRTGWGRDDLIAVYGDGSAFGYPVVAQPTQAFALTRTNITPAAVQPTVVQPTVVQTSVVQPTVVQPTVVQPTTVQVAQPTVVQPVGFTPRVTQPTVVQPAAVPVQAAQPLAQPAAQPAPAAPSAMTGAAQAQCMNRSGGKVRGGPSVNNAQVATMTYLERGPILGVDNDQTGNGFKWLKVRTLQGEGWIREDMVRLSGDVSGFGYSNDLYPNPAQQSSWVRGFDSNGSLYGTGVHDGWDHAGTVGAPITAGPLGGTCVRDAYCKNCGANGTSAVDMGYPLGDSRVLSSADWNYGYGHFIIVRYDHHLLPASTQQWLASKGWGGFHAFVMHAHLNRMLVTAGTSLTAGQQIGLLGNSGQSSGPHLHLELRFGKDANSQWANIRAQLTPPERLFYR